jgi:Zn-dependent protease
VSFLLGFLKWGQLTLGEVALWTVAWTVAFYGVIWTHEMGHVFAARHMGILARRITLWPLGGLAHMEKRSPSPGAEMFISAAGPAVHMAWFLVAGAPYLYFVKGTPHDLEMWGRMLDAFVWLQVGLLVFNLLPFYPMDGGSILRGFLARRMNANRASLYTAYIGFAGALVLFVTGVGICIQADKPDQLLREMGYLFIGIGLMNFIACRSLLAEAQWGESPYEQADEPWKSSIPQASWSADDETDTADSVLESVRSERAARAPRAESESRAERRAAARRAEEAQPKRETSPKAKLQERIDQLLDRINEAGGIEKLTDAERKELAEASAKLGRGQG